MILRSFRNGLNIFACIFGITTKELSVFSFVIHFNVKLFIVAKAHTKKCIFYGILEDFFFRVTKKRKKEMGILKKEEEYNIQYGKIFASVF